MELLERISWFQDPLQLCAGQPIIPAAKFDDLATAVIEYTEVNLTHAEVLALLYNESKRFVGCGGNHNEKFAVLRKNPKGGWSYLATLLTTAVTAIVEEVPVDPDPSLTSFFIGATEFDQCTAVNEPTTVQVYTTSAGGFEGPILQVGDIVYEDAAGTIPFDTGVSKTRYYFSGFDGEFQTGVDGVVQTFSCK